MRQMVASPFPLFFLLFNLCRTKRHSKKAVRSRRESTIRWIYASAWSALAAFEFPGLLDGIAGLDYLEAHPDTGAPVEDRPQVRKSIVVFGASGYLIFHKRYEKINPTLVARIIHQKEWYDEQTIGLAEEKSE